MRLENRENDQTREIKFTRNYTKHALGSVLVEFGDTKTIFSYPQDKRTEDYITGRFG